MLALTVPTDDAWIELAMADLDRVLVDHAHCEMKAAANAISLGARHPDDLEMVTSLSLLAREELEHFERAIAFLARRGLALGPPPEDTYAVALRRAARAALPDVPPLVQRLLVGALIEARSCERFKLLAARMRGPELEGLRSFYEELFACEARHFRTYVDLARRAVRSAGAGEAGADAIVDAALARLAREEGAIVRSLGGSARARATVHG